jgi:hypothetical protein
MLIVDPHDRELIARGEDCLSGVPGRASSALIAARPESSFRSLRYEIPAAASRSGRGLNVR